MTPAALLLRLDAIDARRRVLLDEVATVDAGVLATRPPSGGWSVLEILEHLVLVEVYVLGDLADAGRRPAGRRTLKSRVLYRVVFFVLRFGIPVRAPSRKMVPTGTPTLDDVRRRWDESHASLRAFVAGLDDQGMERAVFRHPVSGPLTPAEAVRLMDVHLDRHVGQIHRTLAAVG